MVRTLFYLILAVVAVVNVAILSGLGILYYFSRDLPALSTLRDYRPALVTQIVSQDGQLLGELFKERRYLLPIEALPPYVVHAFVAGEDAKFFHHSGVDLTAIVRAAWANLWAGRVVQGGSTITQQLAKSLLLSPERSFTRKIRELILAWRIEQNFSKADVLYLYLNNIYLGYGAYGIGAAAKNYFGKEARQLTIAEAALLAGLPKAPGRNAPHINPERSKERQLYVLNRMKEDKYITDAQFQEAVESEIGLKPLEEFADGIAPHAVEWIRQWLLAEFPGTDPLTSGLRVVTTIDSRRQAIAQRAVRRGLRQLDQRRGYRGPIDHLPKSEWEKFWDREREAFVLSEGKKALTLRTMGDYQRPDAERAEKRDEEITQLIDRLLTSGPSPDGPRLVKGLVTGILSKEEVALVQMFHRSGVVRLESMGWARPPDPDVPYYEGQMIRKISQALKVGDVIWISVLGTLSSDDQKKFARDRTVPSFNLALEQIPAVEGALLSTNPDSGAIEALVGGRDFRESEFNRVFQARRQPGSAFKPLTYAAALDRGFTPGTVLSDSPVVFVNDDDLSKWKPKNYTREFQGDILLNRSLMQSRNVTTIRLLNEIGLDAVIDLARRSGIEAPLERDFTLALGSSGLSLADLIRPYLVFASGGYRRDPFLVAAVYDAQGALVRRYTDFLPEMTFEEALFATQWRSVGAVQRGLEENLKWVPANFPDGLSVRTTEQFLAKEESLDAPPATDAERPVTFSPLLPSQVMSSETAFQITHLLSEAVLYGTGQGARELGRPVAGKTGTTDENRDAWFMGYTPQLVTGVWVGTDDLQSLGRLETGSYAALPIWVEYMKGALEGYPVQKFRVPEGIEFVRIDLSTGLRATPSSRAALEEAYKIGSAPLATHRERPGVQYRKYLDQEY